MIKELVNTIRSLMGVNRNELSEVQLISVNKKIKDTMEKIEIELKCTQDASILKEIIEEDRYLYIFPIDLMFHVFQRLIQLETDKKRYLEDFQNYLLLFGPDWQEEAKEISNALEKENIETAVSIAQQVDYDKYNK